MWQCVQAKQQLPPKRGLIGWSVSKAVPFIAWLCAWIYMHIWHNKDEVPVFLVRVECLTDPKRTAILSSAGDPCLLLICHGK